MTLQEIEVKTKEMIDLLVANGALPPQGINPGVWMNLHVHPISYEVASLVVLEYLKKWLMNEQLPDTSPMMHRNLDEYTKFMMQVEGLGRIANNAPVRLTRIEVPNASIGQWKGLPEKVMLWFVADQNGKPFITKETEANFQITFALIAEKFSVLEYKVGFRLEGQPGIIRNSEGKDIFLTHFNEPGMYIVAQIGVTEDAGRTEQSPGPSPGPVGEATPVG